MLKQIPAMIDDILLGKYPDINQAELLMEDISDGLLSDSLLSAILVSLRFDIPQSQILAGFSNVLGRRAKRIQYSGTSPLIDIVGTGGAVFKSFNVSTVSSLILPLLGVAVAKHGNRSSTSKSGSADLLEALGVNIEMSPIIAEKCLNLLNYTFMFAPRYHPSMRAVIPVRKELKIKTIFNIIGPLTNPASVKRQLTGVYSEDLLYPMIKSMQRKKFERAAVVYNNIGADELCPVGITKVVELREGDILEYNLRASDFGLKECSKYDLINLPPDKAKIKTLEILDGKSSSLADFVIMNVAMAMRIAGIEDNLRDAAMMVRNILLSGKARKILDNFIKMTNEVE